MRTLILAAALAALALPAAGQTLALGARRARCPGRTWRPCRLTRFTFDPAAPGGVCCGSRGRSTKALAVGLIFAAPTYQVIRRARGNPVRANRIIVADKADGAVLGGDDGPFKLVVEGDLRPARGARQVVKIEVIPLGDAKPPAEHAR